MAGPPRCWQLLALHPLRLGDLRLAVAEPEMRRFAPEDAIGVDQELDESRHLVHVMHHAIDRLDIPLALVGLADRARVDMRLRSALDDVKELVDRVQVTAWMDICFFLGIQWV